MEEKLRKLNYELDALTKAMSDDVLFSEVVEDFVKELEDRISALKSLEDSMLGKGFDKTTFEDAVRSKGTLGFVAREVDEEMRTRSSEIVQRRFVVSSKIRELEKKMKRNGNVQQGKTAEGVHHIQRLRQPVPRPRTAERETRRLRLRTCGLERDRAKCHKGSQPAFPHVGGQELSK